MLKRSIFVLLLLAGWCVGGCQGPGTGEAPAPTATRPGDPPPLKDMQAHVLIIENPQEATLVLGLTYEGESVPITADYTITCNDEPVDPLRLVAGANIRRAETGKLYGIWVERGSEKAFIMIPVFIRPEFVWPQAGMEVEPASDFVIRYQSGGGEWVKGSAVGYSREADRQLGIETGYEKDNGYCPALDLHDFVSGMGRVQLSRKTSGKPLTDFAGAEFEYTATSAIDVTWIAP